MRSLLFVVLLLASGSAWAQVSVTGTVADSSGVGLPGATVVLMQPADSVLVSFAASRSDGAFEVRRVREGDYILKVSFVGYAASTQTIEVEGEALDVGTITLQEATDELGKLVVDADRVPIVLRGDTLDYDAAAFGAPQGAMVEDLLRRLPGVEVGDDGSVTAQGETVQKVLVDGKEFFGDDPKVATRNLPADAVERVQVYDKASDTAEFTGVDDGNDERTINLELKDDRKTGVFGNVSGGVGGIPAGSGDDSGGLGARGSGALYDAQASVNRFSPSTQFSIIANINNVNRQSFSIGDYFQFMGGMGMMAGGGSFAIGGDEIPVGNDLGDGLSETASGGLNLNHDISEKTAVSLSYFLHSLDKSRIRAVRRQQFFGEGLSSRLEENNDGSDQTTVHRLNLSGEHEFADGHDVKLRSSLRYGANSTASIIGRQTFDGSDLLENTSDTDYTSDGSNSGGEATLTYRRKFAGKQSIVAEMKGDLNDTNGDGDLLATTRFFENGDLLTTEEVAQLQALSGRVLTGSGSVLLTQPLANKQALQFRIEHRETAEDQTRDVRDLVDGMPTPNAEQSSAFERIYRYDKGGLTYRRGGEPINLSAGLALQLTRLGGSQEASGEGIDQQYLRALPSASVGYAISQGRNVELRYQTSTREPTVRELQPVVDISDPLRTYIGNPDLRPAYTHSLNAQYLSFDQFTSTNLFAFVRAAYNPTAISTSRTVDDQLRQRSTPVNTSGTWTVNGNANLGTLLRPLKSRLSLGASTLYNRGIEVINDDENVSSLSRTSLDLTLQNKNKDRFDVRGTLRVSYNTAAYSLNPQLDREYINRGLKAEVGWTPTERWEFRTVFDLDVYGNAVVGGGSGTRSVPLWRAEASHTIMNGKARIELSARDLLNRNLGVSYSNTASYIEEERVNTLGRYVLLRFVYNLGAKGSGSGITFG